MTNQQIGEKIFSYAVTAGSAIAACRQYVATIGVRDETGYKAIRAAFVAASKAAGHEPGYTRKLWTVSRGSALKPISAEAKAKRNAAKAARKAKTDNARKLAASPLAGLSAEKQELLKLWDAGDTIGIRRMCDALDAERKVKRAR